MTIYPIPPNDANTFLAPSPVVPFSLLISNITQSNPCVVSVTVTAPEINSYVVGQLIKLTIPYDYGMQQLADQTVEIIAVNVNDISINISSISFDPFSIPAGYVSKPASISPGGSRNIYNITNVPFHSLDGTVGN